MNKQQPVRNWNEGTDKHPGTSANAVHRISASPRSIKTQIAKVSYACPAEVLKKRRDKKQFTQTQQYGDNPKDQELKAIDSSQNEISKRREEREKEIKKCSSYINGISTSKKDDKEDLDKDTIVKDKKESKVNKFPEFRRCRTEILTSEPGYLSERRLKTRKGAKVRSKSSQPSETKSHELLPSTQCIPKRKSYNVEDARKFLEEQKRKRRVQNSITTQKVSNGKTAFEKDKIKKRLEELRKSSKAIIMKNVNRKKSQTSNKNDHINAEDIEKPYKTKSDFVAVKPFNKIENSLNKNHSEFYEDNIEATVTITEILNSEYQTDRTVVKNKDSASGSIDNNILVNPQKHLGLLRKPETKDHSFSAITEFSFDKENVALEMMTPKLSNTSPKRKDVAVRKPEVPEKPLEETYRKSITFKNSIDALESDEHTDIKSSQYNDDLDSHNISIDISQSKLKDQKENGPRYDLPHLLKPSAVQIYPYNFIIAVRRKLEALSDVKKQHNHIDLIHHKTTFTRDLLSRKLESSDKYVKKPLNEEPSQSVNHSIVQNALVEQPMEAHSIDKNIVQNQTSKSYSNHSQSELNSTLNSISIQLIPSSHTSKTLSKISKCLPTTYSKPRTGSHPSEDETTISSSIFNSPERNTYRKTVNIETNNIGESKGSVSPLSLKHVGNHIFTPSNNLKRAIAARHVNTSRGDALQFVITEQKLDHSNSIQEEVNINQLLDDFNRSLSHVIAVNDRLKTTIDKTNGICGTERNIKQPENINPKESDEYTEDFELYSSQASSDVNSRLHQEKEQNQAFVQKRCVGKTIETPECSLGKVASITESYRNPMSYSSRRVSGESQPDTKEILFKRISDKRTHKIESLTEKAKQNVFSSEKIEKCVQELTDFKKVSCNTFGEKEKYAHIELMDYSTPANASDAINTEENESPKFENIIGDLKTGGGNGIGRSMTKLPLPSVGSHQTKHAKLINAEAGPCKHYLLPKQLTSSSTNNDSLSESTCRYSNVGVYDKLIRNETSKSEYLTALLKMREKALYDRTKGQIAWLEVQKERCKSKGLLQQITSIKKKQRGILLKMQKERDEIKRLLQSTTTTTSTESSGKCTAKEYEFTATKSRKSFVPQKSISRIKHKKTQLDSNKKVTGSLCSLSKLPSSVNPVSKYSHSNSKVDGETTRSVPVVRAHYDIESSRSLEELLRKRESDLRCRREHVERLMQWHRQLDQEEAEVQRMENELLNYNTRKTLSKSLYAENKNSRESDTSVVPAKISSLHTKAQRRLKEIENSLMELNSISFAHKKLGSNAGNEENRLNKFSDFVQITGSKLNKLWRRLTAQEIEKYEPNKLYDLSKTDVECLYEAAKVAVLKDFARNEGLLAADLLEKSTSILSNNLSQTSLQVSVPSLSLCTSPEPSDKEEESAEETSGNSLPLGNYSPSTAAENFHLFTCNSGSALLCSSLNQSSDMNLILSKNKSEINLHPSMTNPTHPLDHSAGLLRSFSDTVIYNKDRLQQVGEREILKICKNKSTMKSIEHSMPNNEISQSDTAEINTALSDLVSPSKQTLPELNSVSDEFIAALEPTAKIVTALQTHKGSNQSVPNNEKSNISIKLNNISEPFTVEELSQHENENIKISSQEQETECNSSSSLEDNIVTSNKNMNTILSKLSSLEHIQINSNRSSNNIDDLSINQSLKEHESFNSKTFVSDPDSGKPEENAVDIEPVGSYEDDFEIASDGHTQIEDLSLPHFESIMDAYLPEDNDEECAHNIMEKSNLVIPLPSAAEVSDVCKKFNPSQSISNLTQGQQPPTPPPPPPPPPLLSSIDTTRLQTSTQSTSNATASLGPNSIQLMPDIINELEIRRCQQIFIESEKIKQFENSSSIVPYMYVREIPNKPPPPYVPPAHGSPMTTIFPSEERIKEISFRRTHELYCELLKTDYVSEDGAKLPSVMDEKITNIYERIILDICREYLEEHIEVLKKGNPINFHTHLAFFNPPNRLSCIQESVYKEVRRCLAMDKTLNRRTPMYSVYGQRAKRDHIGKIIIQEMYDEDSKWCNFHREEDEVVELIIYEMIGKFVIDIAEQVVVEEGGTAEGSNQDNENDVNTSHLNSSTNTKSQE